MDNIAVVATIIVALLIPACWWWWPTSSKPVAKISELNIHPVKGFRRVKVRTVEIDAFGLAFDRRWMVCFADAVDGVHHMITQRNKSITATIDVRLVYQYEDGYLMHVLDVLEADGLPLCTTRSPTSSRHLVLQLRSSAEEPWCSVPLVDAGHCRTVCVWSDNIAGCVDQGDNVASWLSEKLGCSVRLVYMPPSGAARPLETAFLPLKDRSPDDKRELGAEYAGHQLPLAGGGNLTNLLSFADGYSALILAEESVAELNRRMEENGGSAVPTNRFRANILVRGINATLSPNDEDSWMRFRIAGDRSAVVIGRGVKPCSRCIVTTTDQRTGWQGGVTAEPLRTMKQYRAIHPKKKNNVYMGMNVIFENSNGSPQRIAVGDMVYIVQRGAAKDFD